MEVEALSIMLVKTYCEITSFQKLPNHRLSNPTLVSSTLGRSWTLVFISRIDLNQNYRVTKL